MAASATDVLSVEDLVRQMRMRAALKDDATQGPLLLTAIETAVRSVDAEVVPHLLATSYEVEVRPDTPGNGFAVSQSIGLAAYADVTGVSVKLRTGIPPAPWGAVVAGTEYELYATAGAYRVTVYPPGGVWPDNAQYGALITLTCDTSADKVPDPIRLAIVLRAKLIFHGDPGIPERQRDVSRALIRPWRVPPAYGAPLRPYRAGVVNRVARRDMALWR